MHGLDDLEGQDYVYHWYRVYNLGLENADFSRKFPGTCWSLKYSLNKVLLSQRFLLENPKCGIFFMYANSILNCAWIFSMPWKCLYVIRSAERVRVHISDKRSCFLRIVCPGMCCLPTFCVHCSERCSSTVLPIQPNRAVEQQWLLMEFSEFFRSKQLSHVSLCGILIMSVKHYSGIAMANAPKWEFVKHFWWFELWEFVGIYQFRIRNGSCPSCVCQVT